MRKIYLISTLVLAIFCGHGSYSQDFSNKGKDFWVIYTGHVDGTGSRMALYITSDHNASGTVSVAGNSQNFTVTANQVTVVRFTSSTTPPNSVAYNGQIVGIGTNKGIHIVSDTPVVVYSHILNSARSGSTLVLPTNVLGREYYVASYKTNTSGMASRRSEFAVCATEDNTTIEVTAPVPDGNSTYPANTPFQITLNKGDVFQFQSANDADVTGAYVKSIATAGAPCKPIAVYAGSTWTAMGCANAGSGDNLYQQLFPLVSWGQEYITAPFISRSYDVFRILVKDPTTIVQVNGVPLSLATLINNNYYDFNTSGNNTPRIITSDKPICVVQYMITQNCDNVNSDPEMVMLNSIEQTISDITVLSARNDLTPPATNITSHYLNIIVPTPGLNSLLIDGAPYTATAVPIATTNYSYIQENITASTNANPTHRVTCDSGFLAIAYGYGNVESYGYNAGTNVRDLYQFVTIYNQYATVPFPAGCKNSPLQFSMTFPYQPTEIHWVFGAALNAMGVLDTTIGPTPAPVYDSSWVVNGKTLYRYKLPSYYTITASGTYPITVLASNPTPDGCSGIQEIKYDLQVFDPPIADFTFNNVCFNQTMSFFDNSNTGGRPVISRYWNFGDLSTSTVNNPTHLYAASGTYNVKYSLITDIGCLSDTAQHIVSVNPIPTAGISGSTTVCQNATPPTVAFVGAYGTAPYTFTYNINGGSNQTVVSVGTFASVTVPTTTPGTYVYNLISVQDSNSPSCSQLQTGSVTMVVNPLPTANITGTIEVCQNATSPVISFTGAGTISPYTFTYNINGGPNQTVTSVSNTATVTAPTITPGTFVYTLVSVQDASTTLCSQLQTGTATVTVNPLPTASISGSAVEVCHNTASPTISFTGAGGVSPYTFTYNINGGPNQTVVSVGNIATVTVPTSIVGTFVYNLLSVQDATATLCSQAQSGSATIVVNPLPTSNFSFTIPSCETRTISFTDLSVPNVGTIITWQWDFGDGTPNITINAPASPNVTHTFASAGTYNVVLTTTTDKGCVSVTPAQQVVIHPRPLAGYIIPEVCLSDTYAQFIDTSKVTLPSTITNWQWTFGDPGSGPLNNSTVQNPTHSYSATGPYNAQLIVTSNHNCKDTIMQTLYVNGSFPAANFTVPNPASLCANDSVAIVEASTVFPGFITKIEIYWDNTGQPGVFQIDDYPFTGKVYKHLYPNFQSPLTKIYTIRYRAYSGGVCVNDKISTITVNAAPLVQFNNIPNICLDAAPYTLTQGSEIGGVPGSGVYSGPGVTVGGIFDPAVAGPGVHTILYSFTSATGGCVDTMSNTITVYDPPVANFTVSSPDCETKAITFSSTSTTPVGTLTTWTWDFGDGTPLVIRLTPAPFTHVFAAWGVYQVKLFVTTSNGCKSVVKTIPVTIHPQPKPDFSIPLSACLPDASVSFGNLSTIADGSQANFSYLWNFGDPGSGPLNTSTLNNPSHIYTTTGPFNVNLQVTSADGCVHDTTILLNTVHPQPLASFTVDKIDVCIGSPIQFTNTSNPLDGITTQYNWTMGDGNVRNTPGFAYTYSNLGVYDVSLFIFNNHGCRSTTYTKSVSVNPYPPVNAGPDKFMLQGGQVTLTPVLTATMPVTYLWSPPQYLSDPTIAFTIASPPDDKTYILKITTDKGCSKTDDVFIKVLKLPAIPNIFSPNGDGIHDTWVIEYLESYPGSTVDIFNRYGQLIWHSEGYSNPWDGTINGKPVPVGTYYYIVSPKNGRRQMSGYVDVIR